jgi:hypothetical protein
MKDIVGVLKQAARTPGSVPLPKVLEAIVSIEKAKVKPTEEWWATISAPDKRWRLIYTASKMRSWDMMHWTTNGDERGLCLHQFGPWGEKLCDA